MCKNFCEKQFFDSRRRQGSDLCLEFWELEFVKDFKRPFEQGSLFRNFKR